MHCEWLTYLSRRSRAVAMEALAPLLVEKLADGGEVVMTVTGNSMYPMLRDQADSVLLVSESGGRVRMHDIPLYRRRDGAYILHRVVAIHGDRYLTAGDGQGQSEMIESDQVIGVVRGFWRNERYLSCSHPAYRLYAVLWTWLMPVRRYLLRAILMLLRHGKGRSNDRDDRGAVPD